MRTRQGIGGRGSGIGWLLPVVCLALLASAERVYTQGGQGASWAWKPAIPTGDDGSVHVLPVRGNVYMPVGAGGNITLLTQGQR